MTDRIEISGLAVMGTHGVHDFEKQLRQPFEVDLSLDVDLRKACVSDDLSDTVSYVDVVAAVKSAVETEQYQLIERLAERIAEVVLADSRIVGVDVTVRKPHAAVEAHISYVAVAIHRP